MTDATDPTEKDALLEVLAERLGGSDPALRQLLMASFGEAAGAASGPDPQATEEELRSLRRGLRQSERLNRALMAKLEMLACALGACPSCWGADARCPDCGGEGRPGRMEPDAQCFERFVAPLLDHLADDYGWTPDPGHQCQSGQQSPRGAGPVRRRHTAGTAPARGTFARPLNPIPANKESKSDG